MKRKTIALSRRYASALRAHLKRGSGASLQPALGLGGESVAIGLETLDLARIHEQALAAVLSPETSPRAKAGIIKRSRLFFTEAIIPIEETHRAALKANAHLDKVSKTLGRRTVDLAAANRSLQQGIARRKTAERALRKSDGHTKKLLEESRRLQKHLQLLTHQIMSAQEHKRKKISHTLQDEIAQTLLGINVHLLTLKQEAAVNAKGFKKDIASTQRLVGESIQSINRFARELDIPQPV